MTDNKFSGRTTCYEHKFDGRWENYPKNHGRECIRDVKFFDVQWSNCPVEIEDEVIKMWRDWELGNDHYIVKWEWDDISDDYPLVTEFLKSKGLTEKDIVIIHWWW